MKKLEKNRKKLLGKDYAKKQGELKNNEAYKKRVDKANLIQCPCCKKKTPQEDYLQSPYSLGCPYCGVCFLSPVMLAAAQEKIKKQGKGVDIIVPDKATVAKFTKSNQEEKSKMGMKR